ncbi:thiamine ABC transporter substrate-binding protein [Halobiforma nitratireducens]|uniref:ThiB subfamily ABC transporter periplasmic binding protein n=1 Tax=Halobiforma nitratireducens JCM 10879 TaxID=1227454 RepID=M0M947_9EURY|nr:thiamine ABC transporter substrate-binding protein [Halobiforma nitratireducens]EMA40925.1 ThiB subfamily ABC transporter periplasmic binding protein [Halobiforma nitratireducens JCM 10879]
MRRRALVRSIGVGSTVAIGGLGSLAGCLTRSPEENGPEPEPDDEETLRIATYSSMVTGETPAGEWLAEAFEAEHEDDPEIVWTVAEAGIENYVRRAQLEAPIDADLFLGLTPPELVYVDETLQAGRLFETLDRDRLAHVDRVQPALVDAVDDPRDRLFPFDTGYVTVVADATALEDGDGDGDGDGDDDDDNDDDESPGVPESLADLLEPKYEDALVVQDPRRSDPGRAFLLWTVAEYGDEYLEYWRELRENGVRVRQRWTDAYRESYLEGERPLVVSYSTDRVGASAAGRELRGHTVTPLEGTGVETVESVAVFAESPRTELAYDFVDFLLSRPAQREIALRNVQFPAVEPAYVDLDERFAEHAIEPEESVTFTYDDLRGTMTGRLEEWEREIV